MLMISARSVGESDWRRRLPFLAFLARISTGTVSGSAFVKKEPTFCPPMIFRMVLYFIPLQMTTPQPLSRAQSEDFTFDSIPPVPVNDFSPNLVDVHLLMIASIVLNYNVADALDDVQIFRIEGVHDPRVLERWRLVVDPVHVRHEDSEVGLGLYGDCK